MLGKIYENKKILKPILKDRVSKLTDDEDLYPHFMTKFSLFDVYALFQE